MKKSEQNLRERWGIIKYTNICVMGISEGKESEKGAENFFKEIMAEMFTNALKNINIQIQEISTNSK